VKSQLFKENPLNQAATDAKRVQDVDFPVVPAQTRNERRAADSAEIVLFLSAASGHSLLSIRAKWQNGVSPR
jgi:hypothetical protein